MSNDELLSDELERLVNEYHDSPDNGVKTEAWNLIADFSVEKADFIIQVLRRAGR